VKDEQDHDIKEKGQTYIMDKKVSSMYLPRSGSAVKRQFSDLSHRRPTPGQLLAQK
jgi:hypothetical protein